MGIDPPTHVARQLLSPHIRSVFLHVFPPLVLSHFMLQGPSLLQLIVALLQASCPEQEMVQA